MPAKQKKKTSRKTTAKKITQKDVVELSEEVSLAMLMGVASVLLGVGAMTGKNSYIALLAILSGCLAVWWSLRLKQYHHTFMAMVGILVAIVAIWAYALSVEAELAYASLL